MIASQELNKVMVALYGREDLQANNMVQTIEHLRVEAELMHLVRESGALGTDIKQTLNLMGSDRVKIK